jgi:hypothetical protein
MLLYMLSSWHMYEMHLALFLKAGCDIYSIIEFYQMGNIAIEIVLFILRNLIKSFALVVNYLQKGVEKVSWQMRGIMIGYILGLNLKSMRQVLIMF